MCQIVVWCVFINEQHCECGSTSALLTTTSDDVIALVYSVCFYVVYSNYYKYVYTVFDKRTTDSVAIYLLPQIYCPVEIGGTTEYIFGSLIEICLLLVCVERDMTCAFCLM